MPQINIPDVGVVRFPEDMSRPDIEQAAKRVYRQGQQRKAAKQGDVGTYEFLSHPDAAPEMPKTHQGGLFSQAGLGLTQGMGQLSQQANTVLAETIRGPLGKLSTSLIPSTPEQQSEMDASREQIADQVYSAGEMAGGAGQQVGALRADTGGPEFVGDAAAAATSIVPTIAVAKLGLPAMALAAGAQSFGAAMPEAEQAYLKQGLSEDAARGIARRDALEQGFVTALVTAAFGKTGVEALGQAAATGKLPQLAAQFLKHAGLEGAEEEVDEFLQSMMEEGSYNPGQTASEVVQRVGKAGQIGMTLGAAVQGANQASEFLGQRQRILKGDRRNQPEPQAIPPEGIVIPPQDESQEVPTPSPADPTGATTTPADGLGGKKAAPVAGRPAPPAASTDARRKLKAEHPAGGEPAGDPGTFPMPESIQKQLDEVAVEEDSAAEPWQQTIGKYLAGYSFDERQTRQNDHRHEVAKAVAAEKAVPEEVLAEYPEIKIYTHPGGHKIVSTYVRPNGTVDGYFHNDSTLSREINVYGTRPTFTEGANLRKSLGIAHRHLEQALNDTGPLSLEDAIRQYEEVTQRPEYQEAERQVQNDPTIQSLLTQMESRMTSEDAHDEALADPVMQKLNSEHDRYLLEAVEKPRPAERKGELARGLEPPRGADKGGNSTSGKPAPVSAPTTKSKPSNMAARKPRRSAARAVMGDVLDDIEQDGKLMSPSKARKVKGEAWWRQNKSLYEDFAKLPPSHNFIYGGNRTPDQVLKSLGLENPKYTEMDLATFAAGIKSASAGRVETTKALKQEEKQLREEARQRLNFERANDKEIGRPMPTGDLNVGDEIEIDGTALVVEAVDPDTGDAILDNGKRFGRQRVSESEVVYVEKLERAEVEDDFTLEYHDDDSLQGVKDREAEQAQKRAAQEEMQRQAAAPLTGTTGDLGQGDLLDAPDDLFAPPTPGNPQTLDKATLPRQVDDAVAGPDPAGEQHPQTIVDYLVKALDVPLRQGVVPGKTGFFRVKPEVIRAKFRNRLTTITHEVGHYLHKTMFAGGVGGPAAGLELMALGAPGQGNSSATASSTQSYQLGEGVAEFVRFYLTDPAVARASAPHFHAFFEAHLQAEHPAAAQVLESAGKMVAAYINQPAAATLRGMINFTPENPSQPWSQRFQKLYDNWFNELAPLERAGKMLKAFGLPAELSEHANRLAVNYLGGWVGKAEHSLFRRQVDYEQKDVGPALREILSGVTDQREFATWLVGLRVLEKGANKTGFNENQVRELQAWVKSRKGEYEGARRKLEKFLDNELQMAQDAGFITASERKQIKRANQFYVPFHRDKSGLAAGGGGGGRGFIDVPKPLKRFVGDDHRIYNPLESIVKNVYSLRDAAERNRVGQAFVGAVEQTDGGGRLTDPIAKKLKPITVPEEDLRRWLKETGLDQIDDVNDALEGRELALRIWQLHDQQTNPGQGVYQVWRDGKRERWQLDDPELYRALMLADNSAAGILDRWAIFKPIREMTRLLRAGATNTLEFISRNPFRDQFAAAVYSKHGFIPFVDGARGLFHAIGKTDLYWDYVKAGARYADFVASDRSDLRAKLEEVAGAETAGQMVKKWGNPLLTMQKVSEKMELASRIYEFKRAKDNGLSDVEAANAAKDLTLNFSRAGFQGRGMNKIIPFYNAMLQDMDKFAREHDPRNLRNASKVASKGFLYITLPSILAWFMGKDDEEIQAMPDWRKNFFWNIRVGEDIISLPKPFLLGHVYGTSVERGLDYLYGKDPNAVRKWGKELTGMVNPVPFLNPDLMPAGIKPAVEAMSNHSFFRDAPIEGFADQRLPAQFRQTPGTSETAKKASDLGAFLSGDADSTLSPAVIDNTIRGTLGGLGKYGTDALDFFLAKTKMVDIPPAPAKSWKEMPGLRAFAQSPYAATQDVQRFYTGLDRAEKLMATFRDLQTISDPRAGAFWRSNQDRVAYYQTPFSGGRTYLDALRQGRDHLGQINKAMLMLRQSREIAPQEKANRLQFLSTQRNQAAKFMIGLLHRKDLKKVY